MSQDNIDVGDIILAVIRGVKILFETKSVEMTHLLFYWAVFDEEL